ncbi:MAG: hypothetical protein AAFO06_23070 [Cyanobacteria bacterium J06597_16]
MKLTNHWAITASLTVCASLVLAMHDATYRPAFVQIAMVAVVAAKEQVQKERDTEDDRCALPPDHDDLPIPYGDAPTPYG